MPAEGGRGAPADALADLVGDSPGIRAVREQVRQLLRAWSAARRPPPVLIQGETGTGKGLLARALHRASPRAGGPFVDLNCAAVPEHLLEAELFGHERGAFTDARQAKPGLFQQASRGALFLDEIGLLPPALQAKLLSAIEDRVVRRLGATRAEAVDVWIVAATNEDLALAIRARQFREDLYHRLAVMTLTLPPLRERGADVLALADHFLARAAADYGMGETRFSPDARAALQAYAWPGNVRELGNVIERVALLTDASTITADHLALPAARPPAPEAAAPPARTSRDQMRAHLLATLTETDWNISRTAARLGVSRNTVNARIDRFGLRPGAASPDERRPRPAARPGDREPDRPGGAARGARWEPRRLTWLKVTVAAPAGAEAQGQASLDLAVEKLTGFGGRVEALSPTALYAVFGLEPADEPAALAAHTALVIHNALRQERARVERPGSLAIALHTADTLVNVGATPPVLDAEGSRAAWGALTELAEAAGEATVATAAAAALLRRRFHLAPLGPGSRHYRIEGLWRARPGEAAPPAALVGRREELELLRGRLGLAARGLGQVVDLVGEPGIGKSRLLLELALSPEGRAATYLEGRCSPATTGTPFAPLLPVVRGVCGLGEADAPDAVPHRVTAALAEAGVDVGVAPALVQLLTADPAASAAADPAALKKRLFDAIGRLLLGRSAARPLLIVVEDLHWSDPTSEECLAALVDLLGAAPILLVTTYRAGRRSPWAGRAHATQLALPPLAPEDGLAIVRAILDPAVAGDEAARIVGRGEGNPLFLEELSRAALERSAGQVPPAVPATIEEVIAVRMSRLRPRPRQVLAAAAAVGREAPARLLEQVAEVPLPALEESLAQLQRADFLAFAGGPPRAEPAYAFRHALVQEVAYAAIPADERRSLHLRVLDALEALYPDALGERAEALAHHAALGGSAARAVPHLLRAAVTARARSAPAEAVGLLTRGLDLLRALPAIADRDRLELALQTELGQSLLATRGYAAPEVEQAYARALELCREVGSPDDLALVVGGQAAFRLLRAEYRASRDLGRQLLSLAGDIPGREVAAEGHTSLGITAIFLGEYTTARSHLEQGLAAYDPEPWRAQSALYGTDIGVSCLAYLAQTLAVLGYPDQALRRSEEALALARAQSASLSVAQALAVRVLRLLTVDVGRARACCEELLAYARESGFPYWEAFGGVLRGYIAAVDGEGAAAVTAIREGLTAYRGTGARLGLTWFLTLLALAHGRAGEPGPGLAALEEARRLADATGERFLEATLHRAHGDLLLQAGGPDAAAAAEAAFRRALAVARDQEARTLELHAAVGLARLLLGQGRRRQAREELAPIAAWFTEGFDTLDQRGARALLDRIASGS